MQRSTSLRLLQGVLVAAGATALGTGTAVAAGGTRAVPGDAAGTESVLRFYAVWWAASAPLWWRLAADVERDGKTLAALSAATFLGGVARLVAAVRTGRPHPLFVALTVVELATPALLLPWQRRLRPPAPPG